MTVIFNPILPLKNSDNKKLNEVNSHWNSANEKRIISVGSLKQQKNHSLLINAFAIVNTNLPSKLMIIGEGEERKFRKSSQNNGFRESSNFCWPKKVLIHFIKLQIYSYYRQTMRALGMCS